MSPYIVTVKRPGIEIVAARLPMPVSVGDTVTLADDERAVVITAKIADDLRDAKCTCRPWLLLSRVAVGSLEEARQLAWAPTNSEWTWDRVCRVIGPSGGSVDLPDGTRIEVEAKTWTQLGREAGLIDSEGEGEQWDARRIGIPEAGWRPTNDQILAAWNERNGVSR